MVFLLVAAILAAILDFSDCSRISACYPPDIRYRDPKEAESIEKKNFYSRCRVRPKYRIWQPDYSRTCLKQPPKGSEKSGCLTEVTS